MRRRPGRTGTQKRKEPHPGKGEALGTEIGALATRQRRDHHGDPRVVNAEICFSAIGPALPSGRPHTGQRMFIEECRRAITAAPRSGLDALAKEVWRAFGADVLSADEASELCEAIAARRVIAAPAEPAKRVGSRPRSSASLERRRAWTASGWMPPAMAAGFTQAENAALAVIIREIATTGRCGLPMGAIAARAGICTTSARNAVREARRRGLLHVEERRVSYDRNLPNLITMASRELALWVRTRARVEGQGGGVRTVLPTPIHSFHNLARPAAKNRDLGNRWGTGKVRDISAEHMVDDQGRTRVPRSAHRLLHAGGGKLARC